MTLSQQAKAILKLISSHLEKNKNENPFIGYKDAHTALGLNQNGTTWGNSLDNQGLGDLARWAHENGYPALTGLIVDISSHSPGGKFYTINKRKPDDMKWWLEQVELAKNFNWGQFLDDQQVKNNLPNEQSNSEEKKDYSAFLLVWNPESWSWTTLDEEIEKFYVSQSLIRKWGCGNRKSIQPNDRLFFIKLGPSEPKGIMGSGYAKTSVFSDVHWNGNPKEASNFVEIEFDVLLDPRTESHMMIPIEKLNTDPQLSGQHWQSMSSGIGIQNDVTAYLETIWLSRLNYVNKKNILKNGNDIQRYYEGKSFQSISKRYERDPAARKKCLDAHGYSCKVCNFNFQKVYGEIGKEFIHVHHITPIHTRQSEYEIIPEQDLCPVCPNCHSMLHRGKHPISIEELQKMIRV